MVGFGQYFCVPWNIKGPMWVIAEGKTEGLYIVIYKWD